MKKMSSFVSIFFLYLTIRYVTPSTHLRTYLPSSLPTYLPIQYAFALARGAVVVSSLNKENTSATVKFFDTAFEKQNDILNGPTGK